MKNSVVDIVCLVFIHISLNFMCCIPSYSLYNEENSLRKFTKSFNNMFINCFDLNDKHQFSKY